MTPRPKRSRIGRPKTRTGCTVCKTRRIKCDEAQPHCQKCVTADWDCEYKTKPLIQAPPNTFSNPIIKQAPIILAPRISSSSHHSSSRELRSFQYFLLNSASGISGVFASPFWTHQLPLAASHYPAVHNAVVAVASLHEAGVNICSSYLNLYTPSASSQLLLHRFAIQQYSTALHATRRMMAAGEDGMELVALLNCVLFICFEFLQSRFCVAAVHLRNGLEVMREWQMSKGVVRGEIGELKEGLVGIFERLSITSFLMDEPLAYMSTCTRSASMSAIVADGEAMFGSLNEARDKLNALLLHSLTKRELCEELIVSHSDLRHTDMILYLSGLRVQLSCWLSTFTTFLAHSSFNHTPTSNAASHVLHRTHLALCIWAGTALSPSELAYDAYFPEFEAIILHVELQFAEEREQGEKLHDFTLETGFLSHAYFVARKCRERSIRRRAVRMLILASPRQEGVCKAGMLAGAARRGVEIEEEGMVGFVEVEGDEVGCVSGLDGGVGVEANKVLPSEEKRIVDTCGVVGDNIWVQDWKEGRWGAREHELMLLHEKVTFCTRPGGVGSPMELRTEVVRCCLSESKTMRG